MNIGKKIVSVSLRSIIHSYEELLFWLRQEKTWHGFRLLTEYHSFLLEEYALNRYYKGVLTFPSPYGVSFILIKNSLSVVITKTKKT